MCNSIEFFLYVGHIIHLPSNVPAHVHLILYVCAEINLKICVKSKLSTKSCMSRILLQGGDAATVLF